MAIYILSKAGVVFFVIVVTFEIGKRVCSIQTGSFLFGYFEDLHIFERHNLNPRGVGRGG